MMPVYHIDRAIALFAAGRPRYWAKPAAGQTPERLRARMSAINRRRGLGLRFNLDRNAVMVSPPKGKS